MASDIYLQIDGVKGESQDSEHKDWIEVLSYSNAAVPPASAKVATTEQAGVAQQGDLTVTKYVDSASPKLQALVSSGKHISKVTLEVMRASGDKPVKYLKIEMTDVGIAGVTPEASPHTKTAGGKASTEAPTESFSFNYGTIKWTYTQQKRADGSKGGNAGGGWNLSTGKA